MECFDCRNAIEIHNEVIFDLYTMLECYSYHNLTQDCSPVLPTEEVSDLESQLSKGGLSAHELEKAKKKLEQEKEELAQSLEVQHRVGSCNPCNHFLHC